MTMPALYKKSALRLSHVLDSVRLLYPSMTILQLQFLMLVAVHEGESILEVRKRMGVSEAASSRIIAVFTGQGYRIDPETGEKKGTDLRLLEVKPDMRDRRQKRLYLAPDGKRLMQNIHNLLSPGV